MTTGAEAIHHHLLVFFFFFFFFLLTIRCSATCCSRCLQHPVQFAPLSSLPFLLSSVSGTLNIHTTCSVFDTWILQTINEVTKSEN